MMNLLIVDDEVFAIQGILDGVDWSRLAFEKVLTANSFSQATAIFKAQSVDVLLCDIEMPMGSGIDLIEWVGQNYPQTVSIILSCHDEFDFAQQAIRLNCMEYCVKPIDPDELSKVLARAIRLVQQKQKRLIYEDVGRQLSHVLDSGDETGERKSFTEEVARHIAEHIGENLTVENLASQFHVSPDHLTRTFKKRFTKTVIEYITDQRMYLASELIRKSNLSITMISAKVGYNNYSYFTKVFRKHFGMSPRQYAERHS